MKNMGLWLHFSCTANNMAGNPPNCAQVHTRESWQSNLQLHWETSYAKRLATSTAADQEVKDLVSA